MDTVSREQRSKNMAAIRGKNTKPEMLVRRYLHGQGFRYRLHVKNLPGKPDLVFPSKQTAIFVHGCFWHGCVHCRVGRRKVKSNTEYWRAKRRRNRKRDRQAQRALKAAGWKVLAVWECQTSQVELEKLAFSLRRGDRPSPPLH